MAAPMELRKKHLAENEQSPQPQYRMGSAEQCAAAALLVTPRLQAQAEEVRLNMWDWHPEADLPRQYMLAVFHDGVWLIDGDADLTRALRFARIGDSWT